MTKNKTQLTSRAALNELINPELSFTNIW